jgi:ABC-type multidrug transport system fused ATPase/permease subunit
MAVELKSGMSGSDLGVALVNLTSFNSYLTLLIRFWASMETSLGAISRVKQFSEQTPIADGDKGTLESTLGGNGDFNIKFEQVTATYGATDTIGDSRTGDQVGDLAMRAALSCIDLDITQGTKLAITGRSGSGKSSLCSTLLRLLPVSSGKITIGGVDISTLDQDSVQRRLNAVSQTTFFFGEISLRENLEPNGVGGLSEAPHKTDVKQVKVMEEVLQSLGIWDIVQERGGLEANFDPTSWSVGQLQLLGLSRAIIKGRWVREHPESGWKILVLDEATSRYVDAVASRRRNEDSTETVTDQGNTVWMKARRL